jgi:tetratricopeptide (TPR) repeat protein
LLILTLFIINIDSSSVRKEIARAESLYFESYKDSSLLPKAKRIIDSLHQEEILLDELLWRKSHFSFVKASMSKDNNEKKIWYEKGVKYASQALEINPDNPEAHFWLALNMGSLGKLKGVLSSLFMVDDLKREARITLKLKPDHAGAHLILGEIYKSLPRFFGGNKDKAEYEFIKALENDSLYTSAYMSLANLYYDMSEYEKAKNILNELLSLKDWRDPRFFHLVEKKHAEDLLEKIQKK